MEKSKFKKGDVLVGSFYQVFILDRDPKFYGGHYIVGILSENNYRFAAEENVLRAIKDNNNHIKYHEERKQELDLALQFVKGNK